MFAPRWYLTVLVLVGLIALSVAHASSGAAGEARYVVRPGDTLWRLAAERYGGDPRKGVWEISRRNGLGTRLLRPGTILFLPAREEDA
jgi:nucleoid-associated protein YgaU